MSYEAQVINLIKQYEDERGAIEEHVRHRMIVAAQDVDRLTNYLNVEKVADRKEDNGNQN